MDFDNAEKAVAIISGVAAIASALVSFFAHRADAVTAALKKGKPEYEIGPTDRLKEAWEALRRQKRLATAYRLSGSLLTFSQVVIGGVLTSSFVQQSLSQNLVGILGLIVLASSLIRQYSRPEVQFIGARQRAARLKALIRDAEDQLSFSQQGLADAMPPYKIQKMITDGLQAVDKAELRDLEALAKPLDNP